MLTSHVLLLQSVHNHEVVMSMTNQLQLLLIMSGQKMKESQNTDTRNQ